MSNATLGFQIDSSQASSAAADLDKLTAAAARTQQAADKLQAEASGLGTALGAAGAGAGKALPAVDSLGKKLMEQDDQVRAFRMEVERLTLKYQPLARATQSYEATVSEVTRSHQLGIISADQMTKRLDAERLAFERLKTSATAAGAAVKAANSNGGGGQSFNAANAGYQFQDIAVTAAMGMSPLMIGLQQGTQLASVVSSMERPVAGLATAFMSLISPVSLITIGLTAGTAALIQYFTTSEDGSDAMAGNLKKQAELITALADRWGDAIPALKEYSEELTRAKDASELQTGVGLLNERTLSTIRSGLDDAKLSLVDLSSQLRSAGTESGTILQLENAFSSFASAADEGKLSAEQVSLVQSTLSAAIKENHIPALDEFAKVFDKIAKAALGASESIDKTGTSASLAASKMNDPRTWRSFGRDDQFGADGTIQGTQFPLPDAGPVPGRRPNALDGSNEAATITNSDGLLVNVPIPGRKPNFFEMEQTKEKVDDLEKAYRKAQEAKADFWLDVGFQERQSERSAIDQRIATTLNRYGFDENMQSNEANTLRQQYQREEQKTFIKGFFSDMYTEAWANGGNIGKAIAKSALNAAQEAMGKAWDGLFEKLASGISSLIFGGSGGAGVSGLASSAGSSLLSSAPSMLAANNNRVTSTGSAVDLASGLLGKSETSGRGDINSFLKKGGVDIDAARTAWCAGFVNSSLEQVGVDGSGSLVANSFQKWGKAVDPSSVLRGDVLLQSRGLGANQAGGHVGFATGASRMMGGQQQLEMLSGNQSNAVSNAWVNASELQVRRATEAADALGGLASSSSAATQGLGQLGQSLSSSFFPAAPAAGGGGGLSWLSSLFGGGGDPALSKYKGLTGLFANGTNYAPGGMAIVGEQGPELVDLPQGSKVFSNGKSNQMMGMIANGNEARGPSQLNVSIVGASGDNHVRMLVQQGVAAALAAQDDQDRRGGFGARQARYSSQKG